MVETGGGMGGVLHDTICFAGASCKKNAQDWGRGAQLIFAAVFTVRWRVLQCAALQFPYRDTAGQHTLNGSPVESGEDGGGKLALFSRWRKCRHCCAFLESDDGKLDDVVGAEFGSVVMGQQHEEQRAEHTALWGTSAQCGNARGVVADTD